MNKIIFFISTFLISTACLAGGSIFGGHKTRSSNPDGVSSINVHICGSLSCPEVIIHEGDCDLVPNTTMKYGVCMCEEGYHVVERECVPKDCGEHGTLSGNKCICEDGYVEEKGICSVKCLITGTCEGNTCQNGGTFPHCWYACRCSEWGGEWTDDYACVCAPSLDQIVCGYEACIVQKEGEMCRCSDYGYNENACACAESLDQIVCGNYACIAPKEGEVCLCSGGENENACACAESLDQIVCGNQACIVPKEGEVCRCSNGSNANACACAESLDQIVCGRYACTHQPEGEMCQCSE